MASYDPAVMTALQQALPGYNVTEDDATWWTNQGGVQAVQQQWGAPAAPVNPVSLLGGTQAPTPQAVQPVVPQGDPAVRAALQSALPGYNVTDADVNWWTGQGGLSAIEKQWPTQYRHENVPAGTSVPLQIDGKTGYFYQPHPEAEAATRRNAVRDWFSNAKTQDDLDRIFALSPFTAEEINSVFPEYGIEDLKKEQSRAFREMQGGSKIPEEMASQLDAILMPGYGAARLQGGLDYTKLYNDPAEAKKFLDRRAADRAYTGPNVVGGYHTTDGRYVRPNVQPSGIATLPGSQANQPSGAAGQTVQPSGAQTTLNTSLTTRDKQVRAALEKALPGQTITDEDVKYWSNNGGLGAVEKTWAGSTYLSNLTPQNFESNFKTLTQTSDLKGSDISTFLEYAKNNPEIYKKYGSNIDSMSAKLDSYNKKWAPYGVDGYQAENVYLQIGAINDAAGGKNWQGSWMSGGDNAKIHATKKLIDAGVTDLANLKVITTYTPQKAVERYEGQDVKADEKGKYIQQFTYDPSTDQYVEGKKQYLPSNAKIELAFVTEDPIMSELGMELSTRYVPLSEEDAKTYDPKTGMYQAKGFGVVDARTGKIVEGLNKPLGLAAGKLPIFTGNGITKVNKDGSVDIVLDSYDTGNFIKGKDKSLRLRVQKDGPAIPYITTERTGLVTTPIFPLALALFGAPMVSGALAGTGASALASGTVLNTALSQGIMTGIGSSLQGGSFGKGFAGGALGAGLGSLVGSALPTDFVASNPNLARGISSTAGNIGRTAIMGGDVGDALLGGIVNTGISSALGPIGEAAGLTKDQMNLFSGVVAPLLTKGKLTPNDLMRLAVQFKQNSTPYSQ